MLEVFNTLLRQLRLSGDYELTGSYDGSTNIGTKIIKAHEERQLQEAVIRTIGGFATPGFHTHTRAHAHTQTRASKSTHSGVPEFTPTHVVLKLAFETLRVLSRLIPGKLLSKSQMWPVNTTKFEEILLIVNHNK